MIAHLKSGKENHGCLQVRLQNHQPYNTLGKKWFPFAFFRCYILESNFAVDKDHSLARRDCV